ncbi:MAG: hypothetical protein CVT88_05900 [Candidatus Altiarchaeales archaeon HGW-Altiarchaeales-1]|nr:MAG: hypothetical protein CVT88_05900 [Candidatus Altiarchaeales archaeon HGW-Altiarchaeales-1]
MGNILKKISEIFVPKETDFYKLMEEHADICLKGAETFGEFIVSNEKKEKDFKDRVDIKEYRKKMGEMEDDGNKRRFEISVKLRETFVTPMDRNDILEITNATDEILKYMDTSVKEIILYEVDSTEGMKEISEFLYRSLRELRGAIYSLRKKQYEDVIKHATEAKKYEDYIETTYRKDLKKFFNDKDLMKDVGYAFKLREVYRHLSNTADRCDAAGKVLVDLAVKMM